MFDFNFFFGKFGRKGGFSISFGNLGFSRPEEHYEQPFNNLISCPGIGNFWRGLLGNPQQADGHLMGHCERLTDTGNILDIMGHRDGIINRSEHMAYKQFSDLNGNGYIDRNERMYANTRLLALNPDGQASRESYHNLVIYTAQWGMTAL